MLPDVLSKQNIHSSYRILFFVALLIQRVIERKPRTGLDPAFDPWRGGEVRVITVPARICLQAELYDGFSDPDFQEASEHRRLCCGAGAARPIPLNG